MSAAQSRSPRPCIEIDTVIPIADAPPIRVRAVRATPENIRGYATLVDDFDAEEVEIVPWPAPGWRRVEPNTGDQGGVTEGLFEMCWAGGEFHARNHAVDGHYITGWFEDPATASPTTVNANTSRVYVREANYHPDGGQVFFPRDGEPYVALLALPGDDITPESFTAFYCDGFGIQLQPGVWHQPVFPLTPTATFRGKQGKVHACVACDFVAEFGCYLEVPLEPIA